MEKSLEVFGTKEVSIKEFMGASDKGLMLLSDFDLAKENLVALNLKHSIRVSELVEIRKERALKPDEYRELNAIRAELREPRYLIQKIEKNNISVFESYKKKDKANLKELIELNVSLEDSVDEMIKFEEKRKEQAKEEERVAEQNRIALIEKKIENFESDSYKIIQETNIGNVELHKTMLDAFVNDEFDYEEYEIMFEQARIRVQSYWDNKCSEVQEKEQQRLENEQLKQEIFDVRVNRLKEVSFELFDNLFKSNEFDYSIDKADMFNIDSGAFEGVLLGIKESKEKFEQIKRNAELKVIQDKADVERLKKENVYKVKRLIDNGFKLVDNYFEHEVTKTIMQKEVLLNISFDDFEDFLNDNKSEIFLIEQSKQDAKLKKQKDEQFEIRKNRLAEIGFKYNGFDGFIFDEFFLGLDSELIYNADIYNFEQRLINAKKLIADAKEQKEINLQKLKEAQELELLLKEKAEKQKAIDLELSIKDAALLKKENAQRVKRLSEDKHWIKQNIDLSLLSIQDVGIKNQESIDFVEKANTQIEKLKSDLLTQLNEL